VFHVFRFCISLATVSLVLPCHHALLQILLINENNDLCKKLIPQIRHTAHAPDILTEFIELHNAY